MSLFLQQLVEWNDETIYVPLQRVSPTTCELRAVLLFFDYLMESVFQYIELSVSHETSEIYVRWVLVSYWLMLDFFPRKHFQNPKQN